MKHLVFKWLALMAFLGLSVTLQSCLDLLSHGCEKPDSLIYRYGLLDNIPAGTRAVFESNTGKLDTATYGEIKKDTNIYNIGGQGRCDEQTGVIHYEYQAINFSNKFGFQKIIFYRGSNMWVYGREGLLLFDSFINSTRSNDTISSFNQRFDILGKTYDDCASRSIKGHDTTYGRIIYSQSNGIVRFSYKSNGSSDTSFSLKYLF